MAIPGGSAFIKKLSQLTIDAVKDWAGMRIENLGAPDSGDDAKRHDSVPAAHTHTLTLDNVLEGTTYKRVLATQISAGKIYLSDASTFLAGYDPSGKRRVFTATPTTPYDVGDLWLDASVIKRCTTARASGAYVAGDWTAQTLDSVIDGTTYSRVLTTSISAGKILLSQADGTLDNITEGITYGKLLLTDLSAGHVNLYSGTVKTGEWYDVSGVEIDATHGINIYGVDNALTTRATKTGTIQCYVGADGKIYAGAGNIVLDATGVLIIGYSAFNFENPVGTSIGALGAYQGTPGRLQLFSSIGKHIALFAQQDAGAGGGLVITAGNATATAAVALRLQLEAAEHIILTPGTGANRTQIVRLDTTPSDVTASRAFATTYTNSGSKPLLVVITTAIDLAEEVALYIHATADPPTIQAAYLVHTIGAGAIYASLSAIVPVGWKYRVVPLTGTPTKNIWMEYGIG